MFGILIHVLMRLIMLIRKVFFEDSVVACDEIIDAIAKSYDDTSATVSINSDDKKRNM